MLIMNENLDSETFPDQVFLGFYISGDHQKVDEIDLHVYTRSTEISDTAVLLKLNPMVNNLNDKVS